MSLSTVVCDISLLYHIAGPCSIMSLHNWSHPVARVVSVHMEKVDSQQTDS